MISLLTRNGIPPATVGSLTETQQQDLVLYAATDKYQTYLPFDDFYPEPLRPFAQIVAGVADSFLQYGACLTGGMAQIDLTSLYVDVGETTFIHDFRPHSDSQSALQRLRSKNQLSVRVLMVSSSPANFYDLTAEENMGDLFDQYRVYGSHFYEPAFLNIAETKGTKIQPKPWDAIVFDATTLHDPQGAVHPGQRILLGAWIDMELPSDWQARVQNHDVPRWGPI